jgi:amino acid permease
MGVYLLDQVHNSKEAIFLGFWAVLVNALFAFMGTELIGVGLSINDLLLGKGSCVFI